MTQRILYLHIGTVKTGTTALQRFLNAKRKALQEKGIIYPKNKDSHFAHHRLSWSLRAKTRRKRWTWPNDLGTQEQELFREEVDDIYTSPIWKAGVLMDRVYSKTPGLLRKPMLVGAKWLYRKINQNRA